MICRNKDTKKIFSVCSALLVLLGLLFSLLSCQAPSDLPNEDLPSIETTAASPETEPIEAEKFPIVVDGTAVCRIIRPEYSTKETVDAALSILESIQSLTGASAEIADDWIAWNAEYDRETVEILVGATAYPETKQALEELSYGEFSVSVRGNKLVVVAWSADLLDDAAATLVELMTAQQAGNSIELSIESTMVFADPQLSVLPLYPDGKLSYIQDVGCQNPEVSPARQLTIQDTTLASFLAYRKTLDEQGYTLKQENVIGENHFATYSTGEYMITAYHLPAYGRTRIIVEEDRAICPEYSADYETVADTTVWQMPVTEGTMNAYVIQLADGSFIVHDTGYKNSGNGIYRYMRNLTPIGEKVRISAIIITHPHVDHRSGLRTLVDYKHDIECEALFINYGAESMQDTYTASDLRSRWDYDAKLGGTLGADVYVMRSGQKYQIANALFEVLYTPEDFGSTKISDYNNACVVTKMTIDDTTMIFLGDLRDSASPILSKSYQEALDCDLITVAHHGYTGSVLSVYQYASPEIVFWPTDSIPDQWINADILKLEGVKHHYVANKEIVVTLATKSES